MTSRPLPRLGAARRLAALALVLATTTACGTTPPEPDTTAPTKSGTGELRTDLDPLVKRFPLLAEAERAEWMSGTLGDDRAPGPSTYWIDAIVTLPPSTIAGITQGAKAGTTAPDVADGLRERLPGGPFLTGDSLDAAFSGQGWTVEAYLAEGTGAVVLVGRGQ